MVVIARLVSIVVIAGLGRIAIADDGEMRCTSAGCAPVAVHKSGDMVIDAGVGIDKRWFDLRGDNDSRLMVDVHASIGVFTSPVVAIALRGHVVVGRGPAMLELGQGPTTITSIGVDVRADRGGVFVAACPAFAHVRGLGVTDALAGMLELRAGLDLGAANVALVVTPTYAFANDGADELGELQWGLGLGAQASIER